MRHPASRIHIPSLVPIAAACVVAGVVAGAVACSAPPPPLVIGFAYPPGGFYDTTLRLAEQTLAADGERAVAIVQPHFDAASASDFELPQAQELAAIPGISVIVGHGSSGSSLAAAPVYNDSGLPHLNALATSRMLGEAGPWTFSLIPDDAAEGAFIADFAADELQARTASIVYVNDGYGAGLRFGTAAAFSSRGVTVLDQVPIDLETDLEVVLRAMLLHGEPDVLVIAARPLASARIARLAGVLAPRTRLILGDGALVLPVLADSAGPAAPAINIVAFWLPDTSAAVREFVARFRPLAGRDPTAFDVLNYDALLLAAAATRAANGDRARVRDWLNGLGTTQPAFQGVSGPIAFTTRRANRMLMARLVDGRAVPAVPR